MRCRRNGLPGESSRPPTELPRPPNGTSTSLGWSHPLNHQKIMGWRAFIHKEALQQHSVGKEGLNEGTEVNHLWTMHHHLALICTCCPDFFTISSDTMWWHALVCKSTATGDSNGDRQESLPDYEGDDNGNDDFEFRFDWGLYCPVISTSHPCCHQPDPPLWCPCQRAGPPAVWTLLHFGSGWYLLITPYNHICNGVHYVQAS